MAVVVYPNRKTALAPVDVDAKRREPISDADIDKINARTQTY